MVVDEDSFVKTLVSCSDFSSPVSAAKGTLEGCFTGLKRMSRLERLGPSDHSPSHLASFIFGFSFQSPSLDLSTFNVSLHADGYRDGVIV